MVIEPDFVKKSFEKNHSDGLKKCGDGQLPLALARNTQFNVAEQQAFYNYPLLRVKQNGMQEDLATYTFRFNET